MPAIPKLPKLRKMKKNRIILIAALLLIAVLIIGSTVLHILPSPGFVRAMFDPKVAASPIATFSDGADPLRILMNPPLIAMASYSVEERYSPLEIRYLDLSRGGATHWHWDFGDGTSSSDQHPVHTYAQPGLYTVTLTASRPDGASRTVPLHDVLGMNRSPPRAVIVDTLREGVVRQGAEVVFVSADRNSTVTVNGNAIALPAGSVVRMRTASDAGGRMNIRQGRLVSFAFPDVTLFVNGSQVAHGMGSDCVLPAVQYFSSNVSYSIRPSTGEMRQVVADGTKIRAGAENSLIRIRYDTHTVNGDMTLVTYPAYFEGSVAAFGLSDAVIAAFEPGETVSGPAPLHVTFRDTSAGYPERWEWTFGDGRTSNEQHPSHVYAQPGAYTVTLKVTRGDQTDNTIRKRAVVAEPPRVVADFSAEPVTGPAPLTVKFSDRSSNAPTSWVWTFGPNSTPLNSSHKNPSVTYHDPGTYTVFLTSGNIYGSSDSIKPQFITVTNPFRTPDKAIIVRTGKRGYIEKQSVLEFVVLNRPATISINGGTRQLAQGDVVRLVAMSDQPGDILIDKGEILKFTFPDMALYLNGDFAARGSVDSIFVLASGEMKTSLSYYLVPNAAYTLVSVSGFEVLGDLENAWIRVSNLGMNGGGNLRVISTPDSTYIDGAMYETVHDWVIG